MVQVFPNIAAFSGYDAPTRLEADVYDLEVSGKLPKELKGTWYRCGPDTCYPPYLGHDIYINGDGMISMFRFAGGMRGFPQSVCADERWKSERAARRVTIRKIPQSLHRSAGSARQEPGHG